RGGLLDVASIAGGLASQTGDIFRSVIGEVEHRLVQWALERTGGNRSEAARLLGINRNTLNSKIL
ncbi:MAG TPA: helix-turn-helix domain-containing protein, partial [Spirochaetota bacterium]|nr:helix-turn-helix domain-containing protein [Spirochaetota bacterium]